MANPNAQQIVNGETATFNYTTNGYYQQPVVISPNSVYGVTTPSFAHVTTEDPYGHFATQTFLVSGEGSTTINFGIGVVPGSGLAMGSYSVRVDNIPAVNLPDMGTTLPAEFETGVGKVLSNVFDAFGTFNNVNNGLGATQFSIIQEPGGAVNVPSPPESSFTNNAVYSQSVANLFYAGNEFMGTPIFTGYTGHNTAAEMGPGPGMGAPSEGSLGVVDASITGLGLNNTPAAFLAWRAGQSERRRSQPVTRATSRRRPLPTQPRAMVTATG